MKNRILLVGFAAAGFAFGSESPAVVCGTGDALAGVDIYINQTTGESKVVLLSQADPPEGQDKVYTFTLNAAEGAALQAGQLVAIQARSPDSFDFGGGTTHAVLLNLKVNFTTFSYEHNTQLAEAGTVFGLYCNKAGLNPAKSPDSI